MNIFCSNLKSTALRLKLVKTYYLYIYLNIYFLIKNLAPGSGITLTEECMHVHACMQQANLNKRAIMALALDRSPGFFLFI